MPPWPTGANRHERAQDVMTRLDLDALLGLSPENQAYLTGVASFIATMMHLPGLSAAVLARDGALSVSVHDALVGAYDPARFTRFSYRLWTEHLDVRPFAGDVRARVLQARPEPIVRPHQFDLDEVYAAVAHAVRAAAPKARRIGADLAALPTAHVARLIDQLPGIEWVEATSLLDDLRAVKDPDEIDNLRRAGELTDHGIRASIAALEPGQSELAVNANYQIAVLKAATADARYAAFRQAEGVANVGLGTPSAGIVSSGETIKYDMQVDLGGYHSDIGRTVAFDPTPEQQDVYAALRDALETAQALVAPGVQFNVVYATGIDAMRRHGFANYSRGHLGHSVGLGHQYEEAPFFALHESRPLALGMVVSLELPYYLVGIGAFQLERMVLITEDGHEPLDRLPLSLDPAATLA